LGERVGFTREPFGQRSGQASRPGRQLVGVSSYPRDLHDDIVLVAEQILHTLQPAAGSAVPRRFCRGKAVEQGFYPDAQPV
jgi:hypothetical protein